MKNIYIKIFLPTQLISLSFGNIQYLTNFSFIKKTIILIKLITNITVTFNYIFPLISSSKASQLRLTSS